MSNRILEPIALLVLFFASFSCGHMFSMSGEIAKLKADKEELTTENATLKTSNAKLEARLAPKPKPEELPNECPLHSEPVQQADGSWLLVCINHFATYGTGKMLYLFQSNPEARGGWTAIEQFPFRATITDPPFPDPDP